MSKLLHDGYSFYPQGCPFEQADLRTTLVTQNASGRSYAKAEGLYLQTAENQIYALSGSPLLLGRDQDCHVMINSRLASRFHGAVYRKGTHYLLRDLHSTNGIHVNHQPIGQVELRPNDQIEIGGKTLRVVQGPVLPESYHAQAVVVFLDLAGFTRLSEQYGSDFSHYVQAQMQRLEDQLLILGGCPVKLMGDGLMGAFQLYPSAREQMDFDKALRFAQYAVQAFLPDHGFGPLHLRVGLHYGPVTVIESPHFDLMGDTINTAARLESANKYYDTHILVSEQFFEKLYAQHELREVDRVWVSGRQTALTMYTVDTQYGKYHSMSHRLPYLQGLRAYRQGDFESARGIWELSANHDPLCKPMLKRLEQFATSPEGHLMAPASWNGIWALDK